MSESTPLDRIDRALVRALQKNARLSNKELAAHVGLAQSSTLNRVRRLVDRGILRGFHADVDPRALGTPLRSLVFVELRDGGRAVVERFLERALRFEEVHRVLQVSGRHDMVIEVGVRDAEHLREVVHFGLLEEFEVTRVETALIFDEASARL